MFNRFRKIAKFNQQISFIIINSYYPSDMITIIIFEYIFLISIFINLNIAGL